MIPRKIDKATGALLLLFTALLAAVGFRLLPTQGASTAQPVELEPPHLTQPRHLRLGHNMGSDSALHAAALRFARQVEQKSRNSLRITVHPAQELGNDHQMVEMARNGELDILLTPTAKLSLSIPEMQYVDLPFYFSTPEELYSMLDGPPGEMLLAKLGRIGLYGVTFWGNGFKHFTANRPLRTPKDFVGTRFRIMKSKMLAQQFESLGATPIPIDFHQTYQALADGAVDGQENPLTAIVAMRFHEVQSHLTLSSHGYLGYALSISSETLKTLQPQQRERLIQTARAMATWERQEVQRREEAFLAQVREAGVTVHTLTPEEQAAFREHLEHIPEQFEATIGMDLLSKTQELRWRAEPQQAEGGELIIGVDADLSEEGSLAGMSICRGVEMAVEEINERGGLLGRPLRMIAMDHRALAGQGKKNVLEYAAIPNLLAIIGGMHSFVVDEEIETIHQAKIPYLIPWATATPLTHHRHKPNYIFRFSITDAIAIPYLLDRATRRGEQVGLLLERSIWGRSNEVAARQWMERTGTPVQIYWFNRGDKEFSALLASMRQEGVEALLMAASPRESLHIISAVAQQPNPLPVYAHWGMIYSDFRERAKVSLERVRLRFIQTATLAPNPPERLAPLLERYRHHYGVGPDDPFPALDGTIHAYELVHLLAMAVERSGETEHSAVRTALESLVSYTGITREHAPPFSKEQHDALGPEDLTLARFDARGRIVPAED